MSASQTEIRQYYQRVYLDSSERMYWVNRVGGNYLGTTRTLEEALYYRDLYSDIREGEVPRPHELNLTENNPYIEEGLKYPVPERLQRSRNYKPYTPRGSIYQRSKSCYSLYYSNTYLCCCRTREQAYYTLEKLREANWDTSKLPEIQKHYPEWYTWLLGFYRYITIDANCRKGIDKLYIISIPHRYLKEGKNVEHIRGYRNLEDALYERDFLVEHDWDYDLLVETINDEENPYYDMELPPWPERKVKNIRERDPHHDEIRLMQKIILEDPDIQQKDLAQKMDTSDMNIRNWLKSYNTNWLDFKTLVLAGEDPLETLTLEPLIYTPDLSPSMPSNFKGYVHKNYKSKISPWIITYHTRTYGVYPTRELALKIAEDLVECGWDKKQLRSIQLKHGYNAVKGSKNLIYHSRGNTYNIRKTIKGKLAYFGCYSNYRLAEITRDLLKQENWNKEKLPSIRDTGELIYRLEKEYPSTMFSGVRL